MSVRRVLVQADVGHHDEVGSRVLEPPDGLLDRARLRPGLAADVVLPFREAEEDHRGHAELLELARLRHGQIGREPGDAGQRRNLLVPVGAEPHEERRDEPVGRKTGFPHERPQRFRAAKAPEADRRESRHAG